MIILQAAIGLALVLLLLSAGILFIGIPLFTMLLNRRWRDKMGAEAPDELPFRVIFENILLSILLAVLLILLVFFMLNVMIDGRYT